MRAMPSPTWRTVPTSLRSVSTSNSRIRSFRIAVISSGVVSPLSFVGSFAVSAWSHRVVAEALEAAADAPVGAERARPAGRSRRSGSGRPTGSPRSRGPRRPRSSSRSTRPPRPRARAPSAARPRGGSGRATSDSSSALISTISPAGPSRRRAGSCARARRRPRSPRARRPCRPARPRVAQERRRAGTSSSASGDGGEVGSDLLEPPLPAPPRRARGRTALGDGHLVGLLQRREVELRDRLVDQAALVLGVEDLAGDAGGRRERQVGDLGADLVERALRLGLDLAPGSRSR